MFTLSLDKKINKAIIFIMIFCLVYFVLGITTSFAAGGGTSVIPLIRQRAAAIIEYIKPIALIFGGFGLIGLAWGAIFGKINWKWFGSLSIGLFLISYMGMTIDYFTSRTGRGKAAVKFHTTGGGVIPASKFGDTISSNKANASSIEINTLITGNKDVAVTSEDVWGDDIFHEEEDRRVIAKIEALTGKKYNDTIEKGKDAVATEIKELAGLKMHTIEEVWDDQIFYDEKERNTLVAIEELAGVTWEDTKDKKEGASTEIMDVLKKQWEDTLKVEDASSGNSGGATTNSQ